MLLSPAMARMRMYRSVLGTVLVSWLCFCSMGNEMPQKEKEKYDRSHKRKVVLLSLFSFEFFCFWGVIMDWELVHTVGLVV